MVVQDVSEHEIQYGNIQAGGFRVFRSCSKLISILKLLTLRVCDFIYFNHNDLPVPLTDITRNQLIEKLHLDCASSRS